MRLTLYQNGTKDNGQVVTFSGSMQELLIMASMRLKMQANRLFSAIGGEIVNVEAIRDEDVLYVSCGEPFIAAREEADGFSNFNWVLLNVGGTYFTTTRSTLTFKEPDSALARMFSYDNPNWENTKDYKGAVLIDRSPTYFEPILNYLRHGKIILENNINPEGVLEEAKFFGLANLVSMLEDHVKEDNLSSMTPRLTRTDVVKTLINARCTDYLRFQGVNLAGSDLSLLDLRYINFKYAILTNANLTGANLSFCCLEKADLSNANLHEAVMFGVNMQCAKLDGANLAGCDMKDPAGSKANLEGCSLKNANLELSTMPGVNFRAAKMKHSNLSNCDFRGASFAGADLEECDLSSSDLEQANLRGTNLKNALFLEMINPIHMAQTV